MVVRFFLFASELNSDLDTWQVLNRDWYRYR